LYALNQLWEVIAMAFVGLKINKLWMIVMLCLVLISGTIVPIAGMTTGTAFALDNSLANTPTMGWNTWNKFGCNVSSALIREMADSMVSSGMKDAGYEYIVIDDCWQAGARGAAGSRDAIGMIQPNAARFPEGMKALADYIHSKGLKLGIYSSAGSGTCQRLDAGFGYESEDAQQYANWGIDFLKYDWCNSPLLHRAADIDKITVTNTTYSSTVAQVTYSAIEAETGTIAGDASISGGTKVTNIGNNRGSLTLNNVNVPKDGTYRLNLSYTNGFVAPATVASRKAWVKINDESGKGTYIGFTGTGGSTTLGSISVDVTLKAGDNKLYFYNPMTAVDNGIELYTRMQSALETYAPNIVLNLCEWGSNKPWLWSPKVGNSWRTTFDISDTWSSISDIINFQAGISQYTGPNRWNDADMLEIGNGGMTDTEYMTHFSMWSMLASPLIAGNDLRTMIESTRKILTNTDVIAINQDPLGKGAQRIIVNGEKEVWTKPLANGDLAVAFYNTAATSSMFTYVASDLGLPAASSYSVKDLWQHTTTTSGGTFSAEVARHGVTLYRISTNSANNLPASAVLKLSSRDIVTPGHVFTLTSTYTNLGISNVKDGTIQLAVPAGWTLSQFPTRTFDKIPANTSVSFDWQITPPANSTASINDLLATAQYNMSKGSSGKVVSHASFIIPTAITTLKNYYLSELSTVEKVNTTISASTNGVNMTSPGVASYYLGGSFSNFSVTAGINSTNATASVILEVWADGELLYQSGILTAASSQQSLNLNVTGKKLLTLKTNSGEVAVRHNNDASKWVNALLSGVVQSVGLDASQYNIDLGKPLQLKADAVYSDSNQVDVTNVAEYVSSNPAVATVGDGGIVNGVSSGTATITANFGGRSVIANVTVSKKKFKPE
jgi:alpha-galactosidase